MRNILISIGVPHSKYARRYGISMLIDAIGTGLFLPILIIYLVDTLLFTSDNVTKILFLTGAVSVLGAPLGGILSDRFGGKTVVIVTLTVAMLAFTQMAFTNNKEIVIWLLCSIYLMDRCSKTAKIVFVTDFVDAKERTILLAFQRSMRNGGYAIGGTLSSLLLLYWKDQAYSFIFLINAISFAYTIVVVLSIPTHGSILRKETSETISFRQVINNANYLKLTLLNLVIASHTPLLLSGIPFWVKEYTSINIGVIPIVFTVNTVIIMLFQPFFSKMVTSHEAASNFYIYSTPITVATFAMFFASQYMDGGMSIALIVIAVVLLSIAELLTSSSEIYLSIEMADKKHLGKYLSVFSLGIEFQRVAGPALFVALISNLQSIIWLLLGGGIGICCWLLAGVASKASLGGAVPSTDNQK